MTRRDGENGESDIDVDVDWLRAGTYALGIAVALTLVLAAVTSTAAFGLFNPSWDGATEFRETIDDDPTTDSEVLREAAEYETLAADETTVFVIAPDSTYDRAAADRVAEFVADGGTLVVLDNFGPESNALLEHVGSRARLDGRLVRDDRYHDQGPMMPRVSAVENHDLTADVDRLTLNHGTVVDIGDGNPALERTDAADAETATPLVTTSEFARLETPADATGGTVPRTSATYPVATVETVGDGRVVVVADPSISINAMVERSDNDAFLRGLYADAEHVAFDRSHSDDLPPLASALVTVRQSPPLQAVVGGVAIVGVGLAASRRVRRLVGRVRHRGAVLVGVLVGASAMDDPDGHSRSRDGPAVGLSTAEQATYLSRRYPDWDADRIDSVIGKFNWNIDELRNEDE